jgi:hypothetical protein
MAGLASCWGWPCWNTVFVQTSLHGYFKEYQGYFGKISVKHTKQKALVCIPRLPKQKKSPLSELPSTSDSSPMLAALGLDKYDA